MNSTFRLPAGVGYCPPSASTNVPVEVDEFSIEILHGIRTVRMFEIREYAKARTYHKILWCVFIELVTINAPVGYCQMS